MHELTVIALRDLLLRAAAELATHPQAGMSWCRSLRAELEAAADLANAVIHASHMGTAAHEPILMSPGVVDNSPSVVDNSLDIT
jgi:hypothetical protein